MKKEPGSKKNLIEGSKIHVDGNFHIGDLNTNSTGQTTDSKKFQDSVDGDELQAIKDYIAKSKLVEAISKMIDISKNQSVEIQDECLLLQQRINALQSEHRKGLFDADEVQVRRTTLTLATLNLLREFKI